MRAVVALEAFRAELVELIRLAGVDPNLPLGRRKRSEQRPTDHSDLSVADSIPIQSTQKMD